MRFLVIVKAKAESEAGILPNHEQLTAMGAFNEELVHAGVLLAGEGLQASSKGARIRFPTGAVDAPALAAYHLLPSVRGDLLAKLGRPAEARLAFERAAALTHNLHERALLLERALASGSIGAR